MPMFTDQDKYPRERQESSLFLQEKLLKGEIPTVYRYDNEPDGMIRDYVYVGDVVQANLLALERERVKFSILELAFQPLLKIYITQ